LEDLSDRLALVDEGDDPHRAAALWAGERKHLVDARQQECPGIARRPAD